jgi:hypothetical protein
MAGHTFKTQHTQKKKKQTKRVLQQASGLFGFPNIPKW